MKIAYQGIICLTTLVNNKSAYILILGEGVTTFFIFHPPYGHPALMNWTVQLAYVCLRILKHKTHSSSQSICFNSEKQILVPNSKITSKHIYFGNNSLQTFSCLVSLCISRVLVFLRQECHHWQTWRTRNVQHYYYVRMQYTCNLQCESLPLQGYTLHDDLLCNISTKVLRALMLLLTMKYTTLSFWLKSLVPFMSNL